MSSLSLYVRKHSVDTSMGAVATLQQVADDVGNPVRGTRLEITIPANNRGNANPVDVAPGRWQVEATLPSGEIITTEVAIESGKDLTVPLQSVEHSPREWLGMQYLVGNIEGGETLRRLNSGKQLAASSISGAGERHSQAQSDWPSVRLSKDGHALAGAGAWQSIFEPVPKSWQPSEPYREDRANATWLYHIGTAVSGRHVAHVEWFDESYAVSLPLPWMTVRGDRDASAEIMVGLEPMEDKVRIGVVVDDPDFAPMAGLMTAATLPKAAGRFRAGAESAVWQERASACCDGRCLCPAGGGQARRR